MIFCSVTCVGENSRLTMQSRNGNSGSACRRFNRQLRKVSVVGETVAVLINTHKATKNSKMRRVKGSYRRDFVSHLYRPIMREGMLSLPFSVVG